MPDAPRTPSNSYPPSWDWKILESDYTADINKKFKKKNHRTSNENISSKNNTNTISESIETNNGVMKNSSTQELISTFPDLNENEKAEPETTETNENTTHIQEVSIACHLVMRPFLLICKALYENDILHESYFLLF